MILILFIISALPVFLLGLYIYNKDKDKEPMSLLIKLFFGGIGSAFLTLIILSISGIFFPIFAADYSQLNLFELFIYAFIGVALREEFSKWIFTYSISYRNKHYEEKYDMIVYSVFVALGFAFFENLTYVFQGGIITGIIRAISAVPGHAFDGVFMGYYLSEAKHYEKENNKSLKNKNLVLSIITPILLHGFYDYCLMSESFILAIVFLIFLILLYIFSIKKVRHVSKISNPNKEEKQVIYKDKFCPNCGRPVNSNYCPGCGRKNI